MSWSCIPAANSTFGFPALDNEMGGISPLFFARARILDEGDDEDDDEDEEERAAIRDRATTISARL